MLQGDYDNWVISSCAYYKQQQSTSDDPKLVELSTDSGFRNEYTLEYFCDMQYNEFIRATFYNDQKEEEKKEETIIEVDQISETKIDFNDL